MISNINLYIAPFFDGTCTGGMLLREINKNSTNLWAICPESY